MADMLVKMLSDASNYVVLHTPGREYPGLVLQGDSLRRLARLAEQVYALARQSGNATLQEEAEDLRDELKDRALFYEKVLDEHGLALPYPDRISSI
jgi:hypothetical protein